MTLSDILGSLNTGAGNLAESIGYKYGSAQPWIKPNMPLQSGNERYLLESNGKWDGGMAAPSPMDKSNNDWYLSQQNFKTPQQAAQAKQALLQYQSAKAITDNVENNQ